MQRAIVLVILLSAPLGAAADVVTLSNGDRLTGAVVELTDARLRFRSELAGTVTVAWSDVKTLETDSPLAATLADRQVLVGVVSAEEDAVNIETQDASHGVARDELHTLRTPEAQQHFKRRLRPNPLQLWTGHFDTGLAASRGNSDTTTFSLGFSGERQTLQDKWTAYLTSLFTRDSTAGPGQTIADSLRYGSRYERNFAERLFSFGFTDFEADAVQELDLRWVLGGGLGYHLRRTALTELQVFTGGSLNQEFFEGEDPRRTGEVLAGEEFSHRLTSRTTLRERFTFYPNVNEPGEYRITLDAIATHRLSNWLSWQATLSNRFLSNPPPGRKRNDLVFTTGLRFSLGERPR